MQIFPLPPDKSERCQDYRDAIILNGNIKIEAMILKISPIVNPRILNGSNRIQKKIKIKKTPIARGQHIVNNMQKSIRVIKNFILG
jgi:hypothetical protein